MGAFVKCKICKFELCMGHSHHTGSTQMVCCGCGGMFLIVPENPWGPSIGEKIKVIGDGYLPNRIKKKSLHKNVSVVKNKDTVVDAVLAKEILVEIEGEIYDFVEYDLIKNVCPNCPDNSKMFFKTKTGVQYNCPVCDGGQLAIDAIMY